ncbi:MAG: hypothetical protein V1799_05710 [bacterium]
MKQVIILCSFLINAALLSIAAFAQEKSSIQLDSLFKSRVQLEEQELFDFLTNFKFIYIDKQNEFNRARQLKRIDSITSILRASWRTRSKIKLLKSSISTNPNSNTMFHIGKYDFKREAFEIKLGKVPFADKLDVEEEILNKYLRNKIPRSTNILGAYILLFLDNFQMDKKYFLPMNTSSAEEFKRRIEEYETPCEVVIDFLSFIKESISLESTIGFDNYKNSQKANFQGMSKNERERILLQRYRSLYPYNLSHEASFFLEVTFRIVAIRFFDVFTDKYIDWVPR